MKYEWFIHKDGVIEHRLTPPCDVCTIIIRDKEYQTIFNHDTEKWEHFHTQCFKHRFRRSYNCPT